MIRAFLINPLVLAIVVVIGLALCKLFGIAAHVREMVQALAVVLVAAELAMVPMLIRRNAGQLAMSQAALAAMVIHLMIVMGAEALLPFSRPFSYWLGAFYGATLISVSAISIAALRSSTVTQPESASGKLTA